MSRGWTAWVGADVGRMCLGWAPGVAPSEVRRLLGNDRLCRPPATSQGVECGSTSSGRSRSATATRSLPRRVEWALLAVLALHPGQVMRLQPLAQALWAEDPPADGDEVPEQPHVAPAPAAGPRRRAARKAAAMQQICPAATTTTAASARHKASPPRPSCAPVCRIPHGHSAGQRAHARSSVPQDQLGAITGDPWASGHTSPPGRGGNAPDWVRFNPCVTVGAVRLPQGAR